MSHVYAYGVQCPEAKGIIHLGATSCYVGDNTDILVMREALEVVRRKLLKMCIRDRHPPVPPLKRTPRGRAGAEHGSARVWRRGGESRERCV